MKSIAERKEAHLRACLRDYEERKHRLPENGFEKYRIVYDACPELDADKINTTKRLFRKDIDYPIFVGSMTGGCRAAAEINALLLENAAEFGFAFSFGSIKAIFHDESIIDTYLPPGVTSLPSCIGINLGAAFLKDPLFDMEKLYQIAKHLYASFVVLHVNPLQEVLQPGGDSDFSGVLEAMGDFIKTCTYPVIVKEVGHGFSEKTVLKLAKAGVRHFSTAGTGGTSFARIEALANPSDPLSALGGNFADCGYNAYESLNNIRTVLRYDATILASGGMGMDYTDIFKSLCLGADAVAIAAPFLYAADRGPEYLGNYSFALVNALKISMLIAGCPTLGHACGEMVELYD